MIVTKRYEWCMGHRLPNHDGLCSRLHGHAYIAEIDVEGPLSRQGPTAGMVVDFSTIKQAIKEQIGMWDHSCMLHIDDPLMQTQDNMEYFGVFRVSFMPTAENIAVEIMRRLRLNDLNVVRVRVYETSDGWAEVHG